MTLVLLIGGARSGKSSLAVERAAREGLPVVFVATGEAGDDEMAARIAQHRRERPPEWTTVEEPAELARAIAAAPGAVVLVVDCLSLWVANLLEQGQEPDDLGPIAAARPGLTIAVSNEVGLGIVPANALARRFRDVLGRVNAAWVASSDEAYLCVAGRTIAL
jgi:adenosylcobinamide kinase / adenosylcobinamide-phosphate guanylyltransferase